PERHARHPTPDRGGPERGDPDRHGHRDVGSGECFLPGLAGPRASSAGRCAGTRDGWMRPRPGRSLEKVDRGPSTARVEGAIRARGAEVRFADRVLWTGVDLDVASGSFVAILGPNGAGKSTLL